MDPSILNGIADCSISSQMFVTSRDIRAVARHCSRISVELLPEDELKIPRSMSITPIPIEEGIAHICPEGSKRLNLTVVFKRFEEEPGIVLLQWTPLKQLISWSTLKGRFEYILEHFVREMPCGADKTVTQMLTATFERGRLQSSRDFSTLEDMDRVYVVGVLRHTSTTPFMPLGLWTHAAVFGFTDHVDENASRWLQSLLGNAEVFMERGHFGMCREATIPPAAPQLPESTAEVDIAISAGGGNDCVTATAWLTHIGAPHGSIVFHPGRGDQGAFGLGTNDHLVSVADFKNPLTESRQFYEGTDLVARTQYLARMLGLGHEYFFLLQDKHVLGDGQANEVVHHLNALVDSIVRALGNSRKCRCIHLVDNGGDVLMAVLNIVARTENEKANDLDPRKYRDVWNLLLTLALKERFGCSAQIVVVAPGIDGMSVWLGPPPYLARRKSSSFTVEATASMKSRPSRTVRAYSEIA